MTSKVNILLLAIAFAACNDAKKESNAATTSSQTGSENVQSSSNNEKPTGSNSSSSGNDIVGAWSQQYAVLDQNGNAQLEPNERSGTKSNMGFNYFEFKDDYKCLYDSDMKFKGTYEIIEKNGKRKLNVMVNGFGETYKYTIVDPVTDELVLYTSGAFMIFKKV